MAMAPEEHVSEGDEDYKMEDAEEGATFELPEVGLAAQAHTRPGGLGVLAGLLCSPHRTAPRRARGPAAPRAAPA